MTRLRRTVDSIDTDEGLLDLRQRGEMDFLITMDGRVLMNSSTNMSEIVLAELACESLKDKKNPRVLVGGPGMGFTLKAGGVFAVWSEDPDKAFEKRLDIPFPARPTARYPSTAIRHNSFPHETLTHLVFTDFRFALHRGRDSRDGADSADDAQRQVRHQVEQQDADFKQRHACVVDGVEPFLG
jgi:hypothetical protein